LLPRPNPRSDSSDLRINGVDLVGVILRARIQERRHQTNMKKNSKTHNLVNTVQIVGYPVLPVTPEAKDGIVYSAPGWDTKFLRILKMASQFRTGYDGQLRFRISRQIWVCKGVRSWN
ncbi:MAG: hypothetical protein ACRD4W_02115, partial [Nitrososphaeraceae archaeon]